MCQTPLISFVSICMPEQTWPGGSACCNTGTVAHSSHCPYSLATFSLMPQGRLGVVPFCLSPSCGFSCSGLMPGQLRALLPKSFYQSWLQRGCGVADGQVIMFVSTVTMRQWSLSFVHVALKTCLSNLLRCLFFYAAVFHFQFSAVHIAGVSNRVADVISHNNVSLISSLSPQACQVAVSVPLSQFLLDLPDWGRYTG